MEDRSRQPEPLYGASDPAVVIPMDGMQRSFIDGVAENYTVDLEYTEGEVYARGVSEEEVQNFVEDIYTSERGMDESNHPTEPGFPDADFSVVSALEPEIDRGKGIVPDGGEVENPTEHDPRYDESNEPYTGEEPVTDGGVVETVEDKDYEEEVSGIPLAGFPSNVERTRVKDSEDYMGSF